jgi:hypothetical protein
MSIKRISSDDIRYQILQTIPEKEYDSTDNTVVYVYLRINEDKDYFMVYKDYAIQLQTLFYYKNENRIHRLDASIYYIPDDTRLSNYDDDNDESGDDIDSLGRRAIELDRESDYNESSDWADGYYSDFYDNDAVSQLISQLDNLTFTRRH